MQTNFWTQFENFGHSDPEEGTVHTALLVQQNFAL
jgi:hypothetical protein